MSERYVYYPKYERQFKKHYRKMIRSGQYHAKDFEIIYDKLLKNEQLEAKYQDHKLENMSKNDRDLHIYPDWILIYRYEDDFVAFVDIGTHSDLFK